MFKALRKSPKAVTTLPWNASTQKAYNGRWCALAECVYGNDGQAQRATLIDQDDDLASLCDRVRESGYKCDIVFCD